MRRLTKTMHRIFSPSGKGLGEKGFTLIELLVVIGILAVLAGVVTLSVGQFIGKGKTEAALTELHNIQTAVAAHMADPVNNGAAPTSGDTADLVTDKLLMTAPHGTYSWTSDGLVSKVTYP